MLFDLRGRGRRRTVQVIYLSLAILMGGGLVLFGVGGATSGGLLDALNGKSSTQSTSDLFKKRVDAAERQVRLHPKNATVWANLTRVRYQEAGTGDGFDQSTGAFTAQGKALLRQAEQSWSRYLTLTDKPDDTVASLMVQAFGAAGLNEPDKAVKAMEIVIDNRQPTAPLFVSLAALAYQAGQTSTAKLASARALDLASKDDKEQVKAEIEAAKASAPQTGSATTSTPSG